MVKVKTIYVCQQCGATYSKWLGRCENCGEWNSLVEQVPLSTASGQSSVAKAGQSGKKLAVQSIKTAHKQRQTARISTGIADLNTVLGGGIVPGSVTLLAGQPGIGKSTLLLQLAAEVAKGSRVLYVSGEESADQVALRAERLGAAQSEQLDFAASTSANDVATTIQSAGYALVVVDSIQTIAVDEMTSAPGSVSQITNSSNVLIRAAKNAGSAVILVGHVTKEGSIAGPKVLEHLVDVVLQFEGDRYGGFKLVRAIKNRFGSTNDAAIFEMFEQGLRIVENPSAALLQERQSSDGSVVLATLEGTRPLLVEIQALVNPTSFGYPKRTASGFDLNRLNLLIAVLERRTKLNLSDKDIYINVVGGLKLNDQAADLAICMAIASAAAGRRIDDQTVVFGEVGLGGEIRSVIGLEKRIAEAAKLGFTKAVTPKQLNQTQSHSVRPKTADRPNHDQPQQITTTGVSNLRTALIDYLQ